MLRLPHRHPCLIERSQPFQAQVEAALSYCLYRDRTNPASEFVVGWTWC